MATGNLDNNLKKFYSCLKSIKLSDHSIDIERLKRGDPAVFLPLLNNVLLHYSPHLAQFTAEKGYDLLGKTDVRFMESIYKFVRDHLQVKPTLTLNQFFSDGFAEHKIIFVCEVIEKAKKKATELKKDDEAKHAKKDVHQPKGDESQQRFTHQLQKSAPYSNSNTLLEEEDTFVHVMSPVSITVPAVKVIRNAVQAYRFAEKDNVNPQTTNNYTSNVDTDEEEPEEHQRPPVPYTLPEKQMQTNGPQTGLPMMLNGLPNHSLKSQDITEIKQMLELLTNNVGKLENRVEQSISGLQTRFVILEGKLRFVEEQLAQQNQQTIQSRSFSQQSQYVHDLPYTGTVYKDILANDAHPSIRNDEPSTFLTSVPESMLMQNKPLFEHVPEPSNEDDYIASIAKRFKETQQLLNAHKLSSPLFLTS